MSIYSKFLWPVTVSASGNTFGYNYPGALTASIDAATYGTILEVLANLDSKLHADFTVSLNEYGKVTISCSSVWTVNWTTTENPLETLLGFDGTEAVDANYVLTANNQHTNGYYPGCLSFGYTLYKGSGISGDTLWLPEWTMVRTISGTGAACIVGPTTSQYKCTLNFNPILRTEVEDTSIGLYGFWNNCIASKFRFYLDRADGTVASPGTRGTEYESCTLLANPTVQLVKAQWYQFSLNLNKEPS
jgi:hypothetical protein